MIIIKTMEKILMAYSYNIYTRNLLVSVESDMLHIYYDAYVVKLNKQDNDLMNFYILGNTTNTLKEKYHNFTEYFTNYNIDINHDFNLIYKNKLFKKLRGSWLEIEYESNYAKELDFVIYNVLTINASDKYTIESQNDYKNFLFLKGVKEKVNERVYNVFIKILYHLVINYEFVYKETFEEIQNSIYNSYLQYVNKSVTQYIAIEIAGFIIYIIFFITVIIYLYYSNNIIIKNIIFLYAKNKNLYLLIYI